MKTFRVVLNALGTTFIEADRFERDQTSVRFYSGEQVKAEYASSSVKEVSEAPGGRAAAHTSVRNRGKSESPSVGR